VVVVAVVEFHAQARVRAAFALSVEKFYQRNKNLKYIFTQQQNSKEGPEEVWRVYTVYTGGGAWEEAGLASLKLPNVRYVQVCGGAVGIVTTLK
jgi:hypothetical protein